MAYFMTTELGREVQLSDWLSFHRDRLLSVLVEMRRRGVPNPGFPPATIADITGLPEPQARMLAQSLAAAQLLTDDSGVYRLTEEGLHWVLESPDQ